MSSSGRRFGHCKVIATLVLLVLTCMGRHSISGAECLHVAALAKWECILGAFAGILLKEQKIRLHYQLL